jgi:hypothetical protein
MTLLFLLPENKKGPQSLIARLYLIDSKSMKDTAVIIIAEVFIKSVFVFTGTGKLLFWKSGGEGKNNWRSAP